MVSALESAKIANCRAEGICPGVFGELRGSCLWHLLEERRFLGDFCRQKEITTNLNLNRIEAGARSPVKLEFTFTRIN